MNFPKDLTSLESIFWTVISMIGVILMVVTYLYIDKLEKIQCACAEHPYKKYIKSYLVFAIAFLLVTAFVPPTKAARLFGPLFAVVYAVVKIIYGFATFIFFIYALQYVRFLMKEKCKCSEDVRREVLYVWSIAEILIYFVLVIIPIIVLFVGNAVALVLTTGKSAVKEVTAVSMEASVNPVKALKKVPKSLRSSVKRAFRK